MHPDARPDSNADVPGKPSRIDVIADFLCDPTPLPPMDPQVLRARFGGDAAYDSLPKLKPLCPESEQP